MSVFVLSGIGIGLAISTLARNQQQAILGVFTYLAPAIILSGFATPIENMPNWCQWLTVINPIRYMLVFSRGIFLKDLPTMLVLNQLWPMLLIGAATMAAATWLFRRRVA
jgi:ABC-2 type transport system permease protein